MATASDHLAAQSALVSAMSQQMPLLWPLIDETNLSESLPKYSLAVTALVHRYGQASAALAASYYDAERSAAAVPGHFSPPLATPADFETVSKGVSWATKGLWGAEPDTETAQKLTTSTAERYVLNAGRQTIIGGANADRKSHGWARTVEPGACAFCLLLATRGAVYRTEQSAEFPAHDDCHCHAQPVFDVFYEPSAEVRRAQQIYKQAKSTAKGPTATRRQFRKLLGNG